MIININPDWRMHWRDAQWVVEQRHEAGKKARPENQGKIYWRPRSYHSTPDSAIMYFAKHSIYPMKGIYEFEALPALIKAMDAIRADCATAMSKIT